VNRQYGLENSKYVVILTSQPTGHVTRSMRSELLAFNMGMCDFEALGISETMQVGRIVRPYAESNGHVTDDVT